MDRDRRLKAIRDYVHTERKKRGIIALATERKPEPSGEAFGEFCTLLDIQLMSTVEGYGSWAELKDNKTVDGLYEEISKRAAR